MKYYKYGIIEYAYKSIVYENGETKVRICKTLHKTNSKLFYYLIIICFKLKGIEFDTINNDIKS